jgi:tRNA uridine 5-carboxymethylaminomethyl modification enzyme
VGLVDDERWQSFVQHREQIERAQAAIISLRHQGQTLEEWLRRPEIGWSELSQMSSEVTRLELSRRASEQVVIEARYAGYIRRQSAMIDKLAKVEGLQIPESFDYLAVPQLRREAQEKLTRVRPRSLGQAGRVSGITPADLAVLLLYLDGSRPATLG